MKIPNRSVRGAVVAAVALAANGCATTTLSPEAQRVRAATYETVYATGSHIPKRVHKGDEAASNDGVSPVAVVEGDRARELVRTMQRRN